MFRKSSLGIKSLAPSTHYYILWTFHASELSYSLVFNWSMPFFFKLLNCLSLSLLSSFIACWTTVSFMCLLCKCLDNFACFKPQNGHGLFGFLYTWAWSKAGLPWRVRILLLLRGVLCALGAPGLSAGLAGGLAEVSMSHSLKVSWELLRNARSITIWGREREGKVYALRNE